jgi:hypothetical protein
VFFENQAKDNYKDSDQEHKDRNPVDGIHIPDPAAGRFIRIFFSDIKIFSKFTQYTHLMPTKIINKSLVFLLRMDIFAAL